MTLKKLLKYLDPFTDIVVWSNFDKGTPDYNDDPEFEGSAMDCPWYLANYKLVEHLENGRSVFTFCMCPGGYVVASSSEEVTIL